VTQEGHATNNAPSDDNVMIRCDGHEVIGYTIVHASKRE
jgi:uncharacterized protein YuzE